MIIAPLQRLPDCPSDRQPVRPTPFSSTRMRSIGVALLALGAVSTTALGRQSEADVNPEATSGTQAANSANVAPTARELPPPPRPSEGVHFRFTADAWFPRLDGDVSFRGAEIDVGDDLDLDGTETTFDARLDVRFGRWRLGLSGYSYETSGSVAARSAYTFGGVAVNSGDAVRSDYSIDSIAFEAGFALWRPLSDQPWPWSKSVRNERNVDAESGGDYRGDLSFVPLAGVRWIGLEQRLDAPGGTARFEGDWLAIYGGLGLELVIRTPETIPFLDRIVISGSAAVGGVISGGSGSMWQVRAGIDLFITPNIALSGGYQLLEVDADEGGYDASVGLQGLWVGATISF